VHLVLKGSVHSCVWLRYLDENALVMEEGTVLGRQSSSLAPCHFYCKLIAKIASFALRL
jgi:hypothetical protein